MDYLPDSIRRHLHASPDRTRNSRAFQPVAYYFVQPFGLWLSVACGALLTLRQVIFYGYARARDDHLLEVTRFYSRRHLIFIGIFGLILIAW